VIKEQQQYHLHKQLQRQNQRSTTALHINPEPFKLLLLGFLMNTVKLFRCCSHEVEETPAVRRLARPQLLKTVQAQARLPPYSGTALAADGQQTPVG
jgi:hypothetical protein